MVHQWGFFGSISAIRKIWSLTANSRSLQAAALKTFGDISGLRLNKEKTEAYWLGSLHHSCENIGIEKINKPIKILGVFFTYD